MEAQYVPEKGITHNTICALILWQESLYARVAGWVQQSCSIFDWSLSSQRPKEDRIKSFAEGILLNLSHSLLAYDDFHSGLGL